MNTTRCDPDVDVGCGTLDHVNRRTLLKAAGLSGLAWLTPLAEQLARAADEGPKGAPAKSVIVLWLQGGPSQLETFDPHPGSEIAAGSKARKTSVPGIQLAAGFEQLADQMQHLSLVRAVVSKEGDHERATYNMKTGYRPDPTLVHPALGAIICNQLRDNVEIPRHISILPGQWPARGGYLGDRYDAFKTGDPVQPLPDVTPRVSRERFERRLADLRVVEDEFARGRIRNLDSEKTLHALTMQAAVRMMSSEQLKAFDVKQAPDAQREQYGDSPFGRGCLAALRLIEAGVRCVEVTLNGWDSHVSNHELQGARVADLDPAFAALIRDLRERDLFDSTIVLCGGEFGRTPQMNRAGGRDHWPHGFSVAVAGGGLRRGVVVGETSPEPKLDPKDRAQDIAGKVNVEDIHATVLSALGIDFKQMQQTPIGRPMAFSSGRVINELLAETS